MAWQLRQQRQWTLQGGTAPGAGRHRGLVFRHTIFRLRVRFSRLDGQYGTGAVIADLAGFSIVPRVKDYTMLDRKRVQSRLHLPADQQFSRSESGVVRQFYDCPDVPVGPKGVRCRVVVATHPEASKKSRIGRTRKDVIYELFFTHLPQGAFTASDVVALAPPIVAPLNRCLPMKTSSILTIVHKYVVEGYKEPHLSREW